MKLITRLRLLSALGLLILSASFFIKHYAAFPDFVDGLIKGVGIGLTGTALIKMWYIKRSEA